MEQTEKKPGRPVTIEGGMVKGIYISKADETAVKDFGNANECKNFSEAMRLLIWKFLRSRG